MKKTLFPLILISLTFVISSISVIADITTFGKLNTFNQDKYLYYNKLNKVLRVILEQILVFY